MSFVHALIGLFALGLVALLVTLLRVFRKHDPSRAAFSTEVAADGSFTLDIPSGPGPADVYFRFELDGVDTDDGYELAVGADRHQDGKPIGQDARWFTGSGAALGALDMAGRPEKVSTTLAVTTRTGSFFLLTVSRDQGCLVRGVARAAGQTRLARGWVYLPG